MSQKALAPGQTTVRREFAYEGSGVGQGGMATLLIDGAKVGAGRIGRTQPMIFSADETADVGVYQGTAVVNLHGPSTCRADGSRCALRRRFGAGPGNGNGHGLYPPYAAQELVHTHEAELGVRMVPFQQMVHIPSRGQYLPMDEVPADETTLELSGTELRELLVKGGEIPEWFAALSMNLPGPVGLGVPPSCNCAVNSTRPAVRDGRALPATVQVH